MKILIVDNNDSFTYNLLDLIYRSTGLTADVWQNSSNVLPDLNQYNKIILSPGPGLPNEFSALKKIINFCINGTHLLGICLGHQAIAQFFNMELENMSSVVHGQPHTIFQKGNSDIFKECPDTFTAGLYHSWRIKKDTVCEDIIIIATDKNNQIMAFRHKEFNIYGLQFHPESYMTEYGDTVMKNFIYELGIL